jgi:hypothetical protein
VLGISPAQGLTELGKVRWAVSAQRLTVAPETYVSIQNPDPFLQKALNEPDTPVYVPSFDGTPKYEVISAHGNITNWNPVVVEYNGGFYSVGALIADPSPAPFFLLFVVSPVCWAIFVLSLLALWLRGRKATS